MADLSLTWTVRAGRADIRIADQHREIPVVTEAQAQVDFEAEPAVHRWHFHRKAEYEREWRRPFPRFELEGLRTAWRTYEATVR
ncbi:hypothetical protein [Lentzea sp. NPDC051838]|uniref:hypothetical protein n=1 Tax=Lentzea sp. NPDC051838 TaxID=3154849 RepID=UPI0034338C1D